MSIRLAPGGHEDSREASCISDYASKVDGLGDTALHGFGDNIRNRAERFDFKSVANRNDTKGKIFGAGFGTTGTRSLHTALDLMNLIGEHWGVFSERITDDVLGRTHPEAKCNEKLNDLFPRNFKYEKQYLLDTPAAELFLDLYWTFPDAKFILSNRPAVSWVESRRHHHYFYALAPLQEPCNLHMSNFTNQDLAKMVLYHTDLVRCIVPKENLFEYNLWEDPPAKLRDLGKTLALFVGAEPLDAFPGSNNKFLRLTAYGNTEVSCASELDVAGLVWKHQKTFSVQPAAGVSVEGLPQIWLVDKYGKTQILPDSLGFLMHYAAKVDCELDLVQEELKEDLSLLPTRHFD